MCAKYYGITDIMENNGEKVCTPSIKMLKCIKQKTWKIETLWKIPANNFENLFDKYWKERKIFSCKNNDLGPWSPSSYVMIFSAVAINVMKLSVLSHLDDVFHLFHVLYVLPTYSMFSHPGWQDGIICGALCGWWSLVRVLGMSAWSMGAFF